MKILICAGILLLFLPLFLFPKPDVILLSFDTELVDSDEVITGLLDILDKYDAKATFFVLGELAEQRPDIVKEISHRGHEIGCHSYSHGNMTGLDYSGQEDEIEMCISAIEDAIGERPVGYRAPYRRENRITQEILLDKGFKYDATAYENFPYYSKVDQVKTSSYGIFMLDDYMMIEFFRFSPENYFRILINYPAKTASFSFHPHRAVKYSKDFEAVMGFWYERDVTFMTHSGFYDKPALIQK